jgi:hypothetical protein
MKTLLVFALLNPFAGPLYSNDGRHAEGDRGDSAFSHQALNPPCSQLVAEQSSLIRKAQKNQYLIRRIEFVGNQNISDAVLRRRVWLQEGNVFTRAMLVKSLAHVSKLKMISPVKLSDVMAQLNEEEKTIDVLICFKERRRRS